jgi:hypothetical protein
VDRKSHQVLHSISSFLQEPPQVESMKMLVVVHQNRMMQVEVVYQMKMLVVSWMHYPQ